ncbi:hypothetical protein MRB53_008879 [Persea americana]|uniref:Uncharacterized protein n=1 Tax=Persea americana TaxID=3435 RepID=A0ACC2LMI5_PERAE|nr:hypothetical protein MRB53_008879 [Persea americana]
MSINQAVNSNIYIPSEADVVVPVQQFVPSHIGLDVPITKCVSHGATWSIRLRGTLSVKTVVFSSATSRVGSGFTSHGIRPARHGSSRDRYALTRVHSSNALLLLDKLLEP